jgi:hypothetical protein
MQLLLVVILEVLLLFLISSLLKKSIIAFLFLLVRKQSLVITLFSILFYPGVVVHELSHFIMAAVLFVPIKDLILVPKMVEGRLRGGSVVIERVDFIRRTIVGIAPLFGGIIVIWGMSQFVRYEFGITNILQLILYVYLAFSISATMYSSQKDLEALLYFVPFIAILVGVLYIVGFEFVWLVDFVSRFESFFVRLRDVLVIPLVVNALLLVLLSGISMLRKQ